MAVHIYALLFVIFSITTAAVGQQFDTSECGKSKGCILDPINCNSMQSCMRAFTYRRDGNSIIMELMGQNNLSKNGYVAVGFGPEKEMDSSTVTECSSISDSPYMARLSYNPAMYNVRVNASTMNMNNILQTIQAQYMNGMVYCQFRQLINPMPSIAGVQTFNRNVFVLIASGSTDANGLLKHTTAPLLSNAQMNLATNAYSIGGGGTSSMDDDDNM